MTDLTLSAPAVLTTTPATPAAADHICALDRRHGAAPKRTSLDAFAADVSRLSDAEVPGDEIADLVLALKRARPPPGYQPVWGPPARSRTSMGGDAGATGGARNA